MSISLEDPAASRSTLQQVLAVLLACGVALLIRTLLDPILHQDLSYEFSLAAVAFASWYGGLLGGTLAAILGLPSAAFMFAAPQYSFIKPDPAWYGFALAVLVASVIIALVSQIQRQAVGLRRSNLELRKEHQRASASNDTLKRGLGKLQYENSVLAEDRARLAQQARTSEERMQVAQQSAAFCVFEWQHDKDSLTLFGNVEPLLGTPQQHWSGDSLLESIDIQDRAMFRHALNHSLQTGKPLEIEVRMNTGDGSQWWFSIKGQSHRHSDGGRAYTVGVFQDVTRRKSAEQALVQSEKLAAAGRLAASIAHEVNNPLAAATNLAFIIRNDPTLSRAGRQYATMAEQELARLGRITKQTLGFYKEDARPTRADLSSILDEAVEIHSLTMPSGVRIERNYTEGMEAEVVPGEIRQVFMNLVVNALQAIGESGTLKLSINPVHKPGSDGLLITVADDGPGIPAEHLDAIFEPFFTTKSAAGTGLGLWLVQQIVERHGGSIQIQSTVHPESHGTIVRIFLPSESAASDRAAIA